MRRIRIRRKSALRCRPLYLTVALAGVLFFCQARAAADLISRMKPHTIKAQQATFMVPKSFKVKIKDDKTEFSAAEGGAVISFQPMATKAYGGKYTDAKEMTDYLTAQMTAKMRAKVKPVQRRNIAGRIAWQLLMDWKMEDQPVKQCETILVEEKRLVTFTFIALPAAYDKYWPFYKETINSYRRLEPQPAAKPEKNDDDREFMEIEVDAVPLEVPLGKDNVGVFFKTGAKGKYTIKSTNIREASALLFLYSQKGKQLTDNISKDKKLLAGFRINLKADTIYMVLVTALRESEHGKITRLAVTSPTPPIKTPPVAVNPPPKDKDMDTDIIDLSPDIFDETPPNPFRDEADLIQAVETDPTDEIVRRLAALRAAKARDLFAFAEKEADGAALDLALSYAESACDLDPQEPAYKLLAGTLYARAQSLPTASDLAEAALLQVPESHPSFQDAQAVLAEVYFRASRFYDTIETFETLFLSDFEISPQAVTMLTTAYVAAEETGRGRRFIADCSIRRGASVPLNMAGALLAYHAYDLGTAMVYLSQVINDPAAAPQYRLYAKQLKTLWAKEAE